MSQPPTHSFRCPFLGRLHDLDEVQETVGEPRATAASSPLDALVADVAARMRHNAARQVRALGDGPGNGLPVAQAAHPGWRRRPAV